MAQASDCNTYMRVRKIFWGNAVSSYFMSSVALEVLFGIEWVMYIHWFWMQSVIPNHQANSCISACQEWFCVS